MLLITKQIITKKLKKRRARCDNQKAVDLHKEAMGLLQRGIQTKDFNKVSAANAILEHSNDLYKTGEKRKSEAEKQLPSKRRK